MIGGSLSLKFKRIDRVTDRVIDRVIKRFLFSSFYNIFDVFYFIFSNALLLSARTSSFLVNPHTIKRFQYNAFHLYSLEMSYLASLAHLYFVFVTFFFNKPIKVLPVILVFNALARVNKHSQILSRTLSD